MKMKIFNFFIIYVIQLKVVSMGSPILTKVRYWRICVFTVFIYVSNLWRIYCRTLINYTGLQNRGLAPKIRPVFSKVFRRTQSETAISFCPTRHVLALWGVEIPQNNRKWRKVGSKKLEIDEKRWAMGQNGLQIRIQDRKTLSRWYIGFTDHHFSLRFFDFSLHGHEK